MSVFDDATKEAREFRQSVIDRQEKTNAEKRICLSAFTPDDIVNQILEQQSKGWRIVRLSALDMYLSTMKQYMAILEKIE